jgi:uncharacterized protein (DUF488 family)
MRLFTIGHSNHNLEKFVQLLQDNGIMMVVDVRSAPYSRYVSHFNKGSLERELPRHGILYAFAGQDLGGRPSDPSCYKKGVVPTGKADYRHEVDYPAMMQREPFKEAIRHLLELAEQQATAILCSEEDPDRCHRHHLIARYLIAEHPEVSVQHIRGDGTFSSAAADQPTPDAPSSEQRALI